MQLLFKLKKTSDFVFDYLTDMQKFTSIHPVIFKIDKTGNNSYLVHETLKFGFIPFSFKYPVIIEENSKDKAIIIRAFVFKITKIEMKFVLTDDGDFTVIEEVIQIKSPLPVKLMMRSILRKQHKQLFENMEMK